MFDFDQTILTHDSELAISSILSRSVPMTVVRSYYDGNWAGYCQQLLDFVILEEEISLEEITKSVKKLELLPGKIL